MDDEREIYAMFKQANVKGGKTELKFEVNTTSPDLMGILRLAGHNVELHLFDAQESLDLDGC